jgi:hypothetical protein
MSPSNSAASGLLRNSVLHLIGVCFFATGFLLTRTVLDSQSQCDILPYGNNTFVHVARGRQR